MKSQVGLWIDHREAVIVTLIEDMEEIKRITSECRGFYLRCGCTSRITARPTC